MQKIIKDWQIVGFTDLDPILEAGYTAEEATQEEYESRKKANEPQPIQYITIEAPLEVMITKSDFKEKVAFIQLIYSQLETITRKGIVYISHIDITDVKNFLPKEELDLFTSYGVKFPPEVHALYDENKEDEETAV